MTETSVQLQPAYILQHRNYRETSLILDVLTRDYGRISLLAKGVRNARSRTLGLLQPFVSLTVSYVGRADLKNLTSVESVRVGPGLTGLALYCGFYLNELVVHFLHKFDPHPELFDHYCECLAQLAGGKTMEAALRRFEYHLLAQTGYGLQLEHDFVSQRPVDPLKQYRFDVEQGPTEADEGRFSGKTFQAIKNGIFDEPALLSEAKLLMRTVLDSHLQGKPIKSRSVINTLIKQTKHEQ